jgi:hypothetical protein
LQHHGDFLHVFLVNRLHVCTCLSSIGVFNHALLCSL